MDWPGTKGLYMEQIAELIDNVYMGAIDQKSKMRTELPHIAMQSLLLLKRAFPLNAYE